LTEQVRAAKALGARNSRFGIFGTSISATWLYGAMPGHVTFFVDEDPARINGTHMGLPILAPRDVPEGADVFIPLIPQAATSVARRLSQVKANFSLPPQTRDGKLESAQA
jgi:hypothetical protein